MSREREALHERSRLDRVTDAVTAVARSAAFLVGHAELVLWRVPKPVAGSTHEFKYRLAYVVDGVCVVHYDNEVGKGDHRHIDEKESVYTFTTPDKLIADFRRDIARWNRENRHP